jgi:predicted DNA binding CopG/RHH family protein
MAKPLKKTPKFATEKAERQFWRTQDSSDHIDWSQAKRVEFSGLKPSTKTISLRLPQALLEGIRAAAAERDVPYQSLMKVWLHEKLHSLK